ncbi:MAG TPA: hypothetical protein DCZ94_17580 [Lentisphaeria bacterium]|nr:hypothetical protein [Lentisphaeria bacterium]
MPVEDLANSWILPPTGILIFIVMVYSYSSRSGTITIFALCLYLGFSNDNMKNINTLYDIFIVRFPLVMILIDLGILLLVWKVVGERRYLRNAYLYLNRKKAGSYQKGESGIIEQYFIELLQRCRIANIRNILGAIYELPLFAGVSSLKNVGMFFILIPAVILLFSGYFMQNKKDVDYFLPVVILAGVIWVGCTHLLFKFKFFPAQSRKEKPKIAISASLVMTTLLCIYIFFLNFIISEIFPYFPVISYQGQNFEFSCPLNYTIALLPMFIYPIVGTVSLVARIISPRHQTYMEMGVFMLFCFGYIPIIIFSGCHFSDINQLIYFSPAVWIFFLILLNYYYSLADLVGQSEEKLQ